MLKMLLKGHWTTNVMSENLNIVDKYSICIEDSINGSYCALYVEQMKIYSTSLV